MKFEIKLTNIFVITVWVQSLEIKYILLHVTTAFRLVCAQHWKTREIPLYEKQMEKT